VAVTLDGNYAWHFQQVHHDLWDFDCPSPVVLFEQMYEGKMRKGIAEACKTGWIYILDRTDGRPLIGIDERPVEQEPRNATAATQPFPKGDAVMPQCPQPLEGWVLICIFGAPWDTPTLMSPGGNGGINWAPMAYSPRTNYFYVTAADRPAARIAPGSGRVAPPAFGAKYGGTLTAVDSRTNKIAWQKRMPYSIGQGSGALVTATDVLFHGEPDRHFQAYDARNGRPAPVPTPPRSLTRSTAFNTSPSPWGASRLRPLPRTAIWSGRSRCGAAPIIASPSSRPPRRRRPE
jgi:alcohol dehydrogenase (cytochrome c)